MKEKDIEDYLAQLKDGWLSEDGLESEDSDDDYSPNSHFTRDELLNILEDETDDEECQDVNENDPPLVEEMLEEQESQNKSSFW